MAAAMASDARVARGGLDPGCRPASIWLRSSAQRIMLMVSLSFTGEPAGLLPSSGQDGVATGGSDGAGHPLQLHQRRAANRGLERRGSASFAPLLASESCAKTRRDSRSSRRIGIIAGSTRFIASLRPRARVANVVDAGDPKLPAARCVSVRVRPRAPAPGKSAMAAPLFVLCRRPSCAGHLAAFGLWMIPRPWLRPAAAQPTAGLANVALHPSVEHRLIQSSDAAPGISPEEASPRLCLVWPQVRPMRLAPHEAVRVGLAGPLDARRSTPDARRHPPHPTAMRQSHLMRATAECRHAPSQCGRRGAPTPVNR